MWDRFPEHRQTLQWFAAPRSRNLAKEGLARFVFQIERDFHPGLDFGWFKESVHGVLEQELERFGTAVGADDFTERRRPRELGRAFECLALRICQELSPAEIRRAPEYSRDWTTLFKDMQAAAELIGIRLPGRGRPPKKLAR